MKGEGFALVILATVIMSYTIIIITIAKAKEEIIATIEKERVRGDLPTSPTSTTCERMKRLKKR